MTAPLTVACVQHCADLDTARNLATLRSGIAAAVERGAASSPYPNTVPAYGDGPSGLQVGAEPEDSARGAGRPARDGARASASGSPSARSACSADDGRTWNRSYLVDPEGEIRARYDKIHLFDVDLAGGESYRESATIAPGERRSWPRRRSAASASASATICAFPSSTGRWRKAGARHPAGACRLHPHDRPRPLARAAARACDRDRLLRRGGLAVRRRHGRQPRPLSATR